MTNSTPTPAAPLTPEPPKCCPACGCTEYTEKKVYPSITTLITFSCGAVWTCITNNWFREDCSRSFSAAIALRAELEKTQSRYNAEIEQFNAGYDAGKAGLDLQEQEQRWRMLHDNDYDAFAPGYAWGAFDKLRAERDAARDLKDHYKGDFETALKVAGDIRSELDAALARAEKAEGERDTYKTMYEFAMQQHEQHETLFSDYQSLNDLIGKERREHSKLTTELKRYKELMPCGHVRMLEILNDGQMPECSVCWLARTEADRNALTARLAELQAVVDAAIKYSAAHHFVLGNGYKFYCVDKQADDEFDAALERMTTK